METTPEVLLALPNQPALRMVLDQMVTSGGDFALAITDLDYLQDFNTEFGHAAGDRLLDTLARSLIAEAPERVYRISGDEFAIVLPELALEQAFLYMEGVRSRISAGAFDTGTSVSRTISLSIGVAQYPRDAKDASRLIEAADAALLAAKENGRNQVGLPLNEEMVMKSCYYSAASVRKLKTLAERLRRKESQLLREALDDLFRKHDVR